MNYMQSPKARLSEWKFLRKSLCELKNPLQHAVDYWSNVPIDNKMALDPYDLTTWPTPWEAINDELFCEFSIPYLIACTLMECTDDIRLAVVRDDCIRVVVLTGNYVLNYNRGEVEINNLPDEIIEKIYVFDGTHFKETK